MTQTMRERLARALCRDLIRQDTGKVPDAADIAFGPDLTWSYIDQTEVDIGALIDAVLLELIPPDEAMLEVGLKVVMDDAIGNAFVAMIAKAAGVEPPVVETSAGWVATNRAGKGGQ